VLWNKRIGRTIKTGFWDLEEFEEETGYTAKPYAPGRRYRGGGILKDGRIIEIGEDDHSILEFLPEFPLIYRFYSDGQITLRFSVDVTLRQIEMLITIAPPYFRYLFIDVVDAEGGIIQRMKEDIEGDKQVLRQNLMDVYRNVKQGGNKMDKVARKSAVYIPSERDLDNLEKLHLHVEVRKLYYDFLKTPPTERERVWGTDNFVFLVNLIGRVEPVKIAEEFGAEITRKLMKYYK
jgi:hypothetical protein